MSTRLIRPPGPRGTWIGGSLGAFRKDPLTFLTNAAAEHGDIVYFRGAHQHLYYLHDPALVQEVLVNRNSSFIKSRILQRAKELLGEGLLTNEGAAHLRQRRLVQPAFHRDRLVRYAQDMTSLACRARERWSSGETLDVDKEMMRLTLAIVGRTLFSAEVESDAAQVGEAMNALLEMMPVLMLPGSQFFLKLPIPSMQRFYKAAALLDQTIYRIINERRESGEDTGDLLSMLLLASDSEDGNRRMTDQQVRDETLTLFIAGHETTATALSWAWHLLALNPEVEAKMHAEVDTVLGGRAPGFEDLPALPYTSHVFSEVLRLRPPAWAIGRMAIEDVPIGGYVLPKGSIVILSPYVMQRRADYWVEAERFWPERWNVEDGTRPKFAYFPFGAGPRLCIGERFAWMEGVIILAAVAQGWRFRAVPGTVVQMQPLITLRPKGGIRMVAEAR